MYMLKAQKRLQSIERSEEEARRIEQIDKHIGGLKIVRGAVSNDIPEDGPAGAKKKVKVSLRCACTCRVHEHTEVGFSFDVHSIMGHIVLEPYPQCLVL